MLLQLENLQTYGAVRRALNENRLELHGWVYDLSRCQMRFYDTAQKRFVIFSPAVPKAAA